MYTKARVVLPLLQVVVASALITNNLLGPPDTVHSPASFRPDRILCDALNAPAALVHVWFNDAVSQLCPERGCYPIELIVDPLIYIGLIGLLWYAVAVEIGGGGRSLLMPKTRIRLPIEIATIVVSFLLVRNWLEISLHLGPNAFALIVDALYLAWAITIVVFYGRDLWIYIMQMRRLPKIATDRTKQG